MASAFEVFAFATGIERVVFALFASTCSRSMVFAFVVIPAAPSCSLPLFVSGPCSNASAFWPVFVSGVRPCSREASISSVSLAISPVSAMPRSRRHSLTTVEVFDRDTSTP
ncbi:hypothetical protein [Nocardia amamiensis]|uniref:hypothetical protein n=1 Tax=Nocardia amamiensis TaxID=404578 RepID=UPI0035A24068